jgi:hypothetical protein
MNGFKFDADQQRPSHEFQRLGINLHLRRLGRQAVSDRPSEVLEMEGQEKSNRRNGGSWRLLRSGWYDETREDLQRP